MKKNITKILLFYFIVCNVTLSAEINYNNIIYKNSNGSLAYTNDGGKKWNKIFNTLQNNDYQNIKYVNTNKSIFFISNDGGRTWKKEESNENNHNKLLIDLRVAPNPIVSFLKANLNSSIDEKVNIEIIDLIGNSIKKIDDYDILKGQNQLNINLANIKSGLYILTIKCKEYLTFTNFYINN